MMTTLAEDGSASFGIYLRAKGVAQVRESQIAHMSKLSLSGHLAARSRFGWQKTHHASCHIKCVQVGYTEKCFTTPSACIHATSILRTL